MVVETYFVVQARAMVNIDNREQCTYLKDKIVEKKNRKIHMNTDYVNVLFPMHSDSQHGVAPKVKVLELYGPQD